MLVKKEYIRTVMRGYPPLYTYLIMAGVSNKQYYKEFVSCDCWIRNEIKTSDNYYFYSKKELLNSADVVLNDWRNEKNFKKSKKNFILAEKKLIKASKGKLKYFFEKYSTYCPALILVWAPENLLVEKIRSILVQKISDKEVNNLFKYISLPLKNNYYKQEELDLIKTTNLVRHVKKYEWILSRYGECRRYALEEAKEKIKTIDKMKYLKKYYAEKKEIRSNIRLAKKILGSSYSYLIDILQFVVYYRTQRTDILNMSSYLAIKMLNKEARNKGLTYNELLNCLPDEIIDNKIPSKNILKQRMKGYAMILEYPEIFIRIGDEAKKIDRFLMQDLSGTNNLNGSAACPGVAKGKVKIISNFNSGVAFKNGNILVTSMTTPNMLPIMKKSSAIITDEGGVTCHAAIISRELGIPCIIGTKVATKVLKDGDIVEVDADKGVVKIIDK